MLILNSRNCSFPHYANTLHGDTTTKVTPHSTLNSAGHTARASVIHSSLPTQQRRSKEGTLLRNAEFTNTAHTACQTDILPSGLPLSWPPSHVTATLPRFMPDHTSRKQAATLGQLEPLKEERREGPVGAAKISQESAEVFILLRIGC